MIFGFANFAFLTPIFLASSLVATEIIGSQKFWGGKYRQNNFSFCEFFLGRIKPLRIVEFFLHRNFHLAPKFFFGILNPQYSLVSVVMKKFPEFTRKMSALKN